MIFSSLLHPFTESHQSNHLVLHFWSLIFRIVTANTVTHIITSLCRNSFSRTNYYGLLWHQSSIALIKMTRTSEIVFLQQASNSQLFILEYFSLLLSSPRTVDIFQDSTCCILGTGSLLDSERDSPNEEEMKHHWNSGDRDTWLLLDFF